MIRAGKSIRATPRTAAKAGKREAILDSALDVFSRYGYRGATLDQIASGAGMSKPNLLYYFSGKEEIHRTLLTRQLDAWLAPLKAIDPNGDPVAEITLYVRRKLEMARDYPRESRLFANEIIQGAPVIGEFLGGELKQLVDEAARILAGWSESGKIAPVNGRHLIFSIWAATQHYADFEVQIRLVLGSDGIGFDDAAEHLEFLFRRMLEPG
ncbi:MAG: TetR family transcriptional regulator C-terminal domain-containing protein [Rhodobacteraceae bacterium]|nr:TetR family transcriptional regulator C-terminal domain-containing protein [Paracoccaceae bacterium]